MKAILLLAILISVIVGSGCRDDKYDVSAADAKKERVLARPPRLDPAHLPPGAKVEDHMIKKGETMPDGSIADKDTKIQSFSAPLPPSQ